MTDDEMFTQGSHLIAESIDRGIIAYYCALADGKTEEEAEAEQRVAEKIVMEKLREMYEQWRQERGL